MSPGDDGTAPSPYDCPCSGAPTSYIVKYSTTPITNDADFVAATTFAWSTVPQPAGMSEAVTVTGLVDNTTYYFAVKAQDEQGNISLFGDAVSATTLPSADVTPPDQITNLLITANTITATQVPLGWTARGEGGTEPACFPVPTPSCAATAFDIRYSHLKIIDGAGGDCVTTIGFDQIACPNSIPVSDLLYQVPNEPPPGPPGSGQSMTVNLQPFQVLTSNTVYYFAIKAIDEAGNTSPLGTLANSNLPNGIVGPDDAACTNVAPFVNPSSQNCNIRTRLRQTSYNYVSVPLVPSPNSPRLVFGPLDGFNGPCGPSDMPCLYRMLSSGVTFQLMDPCPANCVTQGEGSFFYTYILTMLTAAGSDVPADPSDAGPPVGHHADPDGHYHHPLQTGYSIIGNPFKRDVLLSDTNVRRLPTGPPSCTDLTKSFADAATANWVANAIAVWDGAADISVAYNDVVPARLQPWQGYRFRVVDDDPTIVASPDGCSYELVIPKP
jgi:hypothetical protein